MGQRNVLREQQDSVVATMSTLCETEGMNHGNDIVNYPTVHFYGEFLCRPTEFWEIDWSASILASPERVIPIAIATGSLLNEQVIKGVKVKELATGRVWLLTGRQNIERWTYEAKWPD